MRGMRASHTLQCSQEMTVSTRVEGEIDEWIQNGYRGIDWLFCWYLCK